MIHAKHNVQLLLCASCTGITQQVSVLLYSTVLTSPVSLDAT